jgi:hypothetical protein
MFVSFNRNTTDATNGAGTAYHYVAPEFSHVFGVAQLFVIMFFFLFVIVLSVFLCSKSLKSITLTHMYSISHCHGLVKTLQWKKVVGLNILNNVNIQ